MLGAANDVNGERASKQLQRAIRTAFLTPLLEGIACNIQRRPLTHNCCQALSASETPLRPRRKTSKNRVKFTKSKLFDLELRINGDVPRTRQGDSRDDFWTLRDSMSRKEARRDMLKHALPHVLGF